MSKMILSTVLAFAIAFCGCAKSRAAQHAKASESDVHAKSAQRADDAKPAEHAKLDLHKGDHICIIGNTLAERMQHEGWLETLIQARFPDKELVFRNLGYSGDEV